MVLTLAPEGPPAPSLGLDRPPCTICPNCGTFLWLRLVKRPGLARPDNSKTTALVPKDRRTKRWKDAMQPTQIIKADSDEGGSGCA